MPHLKPFPGAREVLIKMKQADIQIAIASSSNKQDLENFKRIADRG
ncbi:MAG: HAD hydrolase-like protein [Bryobacteraceae bacterium]